ncbi:PfkB family carbohydrate kinase [Taklimakanibacter deserti]|uniref:PfkB family carbohydrate kinase n=1 Tax=Taklimakanibacter deserti TaxID=2267839 RepID=UPI000E65913E
MVRVLGIGDNTVDIYVDQGVQFPGGNAVNVPIMMKRLGAEASYLGCIGTDFLGDLIRQALITEGIDISRLRVIAGPNSWSRIRHVGGDRVFAGSHPSLRGDYQLKDEDFRFIAAHDLAHSSVYSRLEDELSRIRAAAPLLSFDYSSEYDGDYIARTAPHLDIAFLSDARGSDDQAEALAHRVASHGPRIVVITRGSEGAIALVAGKILRQSVIPASVVDTLGAGDGFIAAFLLSLLAGEDIQTALGKGANHAAHVCGYRGAFGYETPIRPGQPGLVHPLPTA